MNVDAGTAFGTWTDPTSRLIYHDAMPALLCGVATGGTTLDLGGANGLCREWFPGAVTVDVDPSKSPDVVADALTYVPDKPFDHVLIRYVLHYLDDRQVQDLFDQVAGWHTGDVIVVQFVNADVAAKYANSAHEDRRWFRDEDGTTRLFGPWSPTHRVAVEYDVTPEFYRNRLGLEGATGHRETVVCYRLEHPR